jgi:hypothetical protein
MILSLTSATQQDREAAPRHFSNTTLLMQIKSLYTQVKGEYGWLRMDKKRSVHGNCVGKV